MAPKGFAVVGLPCRKLPGHQSVDKTRDRDGGGRERSHWCHSHCWGCDGTPVPGPCDGRCAFRRSYANRYLLCIFWRLCAANGRRTLRHGSLATLILTHHFREYLLSARYGLDAPWENLARMAYLALCAAVFVGIAVAIDARMRGAA